MTQIGSRTMDWKLIVCGAGNRGMEHAQAIQHIEEAELVGFFDLSQDARQKAEKTFSVPAYTHFSDLLAEQAPEIAVIATPPQVRSALVDGLLTCQSLRAMVIEKPLALDSDEAKEIIQKCNDHHVLLMVGHQLQFSKEFQSLKRAIDDGRIGTLQSLHAFCYGNLSDQGIHLIDAMLWLADGMVSWVSAKQENDLKLLARWTTLSPDFRSNNPHLAPLWVDATIGFESGIQATLNAGLLSPIPKPELGNWLQKRITAIGSDGMAEAHVASHFRLLASGSSGWEVEESDISSYQDATTLLYRALIDRLATNDMDPSPAQRALHGIEVMEACFQSITTGSLTTVPIPVLSKPIEGWQKHMQAKTSNTRATTENIVTDNKPLVSVIIPMEDHRGLGLQSLESWTQHQRCNAEDFELIILLDNVDERVAKAMQQRLRPGDRAIHQETSTEMEAYDIGARQAKGKYLFFTEPHCIAEPEVISQIILFFQSKSNLDGFCVRSTPLIRNNIGKMETRMYEKGFADWSKEDHWVKVILRGFGIKRESYLSAGGYDFKYDRFSEWLLAATLHHKGYRLGYAPGVGVHHLYSDSFSLLAPFIKSFTDGECLYRLTGDQDIVRQYFDTPFEWIEARSINQALLRGLLRTLFSYLFRKKTGAMLRTKDALQAMTRLLPMAVMGKYALLLSVWVRIVGARLRFWLAINEKQRYRAFEDWYILKTNFYRIKFVIEHPATQPNQEAMEYDVKQMKDHQVFGFHGLETYQAQHFRWTAPVAVVNMQLDFQNDYEGVMQIHGVRGFSNEHTPAMYVNGQRLNVRFNAQTHQFLFDLTKQQLQNASGTQTLVLLCAPWSAGNVRKTDPRLLGIPFVGLRFIPIKKDACP